MNIEWDGKGLPPVGLKVQARFTTDDTPKWENVVFTHIGYKFVALRYEDGEVSEVEFGNKALEVRPLPTANRDRAIAEMAENMAGYKNVEEPNDKMVSLSAYLYDAGYRKFEIVEEDV